VSYLTSLQYDNFRVHSGDSHPQYSEQLDERLHHTFVLNVSSSRNLSGYGSVITESEISVDNIVNTVERSVPRSEPESFILTDLRFPPTGTPSTVLALMTLPDPRLAPTQRRPAATLRL